MDTLHYEVFDKHVCLDPPEPAEVDEDTTVPTSTIPNPSPNSSATIGPVSFDTASPLGLTSTEHDTMTFIAGMLSILSGPGQFLSSTDLNHEVDQSGASLLHLGEYVTRFLQDPAKFVWPDDSRIRCPGDLKQARYGSPQQRRMQGLTDWTGQIGKVIVALLEWKRRAVLSTALMQSAIDTISAARRQSVRFWVEDDDVVTDSTALNEQRFKPFRLAMLQGSRSSHVHT